MVIIDEVWKDSDCINCLKFQTCLNKDPNIIACSDST